MGFKIKTKDKGFYFRRLIHFSIALVPFIYFGCSHFVQSHSPLTINQWLSLLVLIVLIFELLRLKFKWQVYGQRVYEKNQISALMWTILGISLVLLLAPPIGKYNAAIAAPLIWSLAFADPALGEARLRHLKPLAVKAIGIFIIALIWILAAIYLQTPWWLFLIMAPITVTAESLDLRGFDDNFTMLIIPLALIALLAPWF